MLADSVAKSNTATTLADFTNSGLIVPRLRGKEPAEVIQELCQALQRERRVDDLLPFYEAVLNREFLASTDLEAGIALPHGRVTGSSELSFALGRSDQPLPWKSRATCGVRLVFLSAVPATDCSEYLLLIAGLVRLAKDSRLLEQIHSAQDTLQILDVLRQIRLRKDANPESNEKRVRPNNNP